jgi:RHS repeat-associated protein
MVLCIGRLAAAQVMTPTTITDSNRMGNLPFSTSVGTTVEHVDLASGALTVSIPLFSKPGRGLSTGMVLYYSSNIYNVATFYDGEGDVTAQQWAAQVGSGWSDNSPAYSTSYVQVQCRVQLEYGAPTIASYITNLIYTDEFHIQHSMTAQDGGDSTPCQNPSDSGPDIGAAGMWSPDTTHIIDSSGASFATDTNIKMDVNGNYVSLPYTPFYGNSYDTSGRSAYTVSSTSNSLGLVTSTYSVHDSSGTSQNYTVHWTNVSVSTSFGLSAQEDNDVTYELAPTLNVISEIDLPNGQKYTFGYESGYGLLNQITLPDGGTIQYVYSNYVDTSDLYNTGTRRYVSSRTETINGASATWTINLPNNQGNNISSKTSTVTFPDAASHQATITAQNGSVTDMKVYSGSVGGTPLREYQIQYATDPNPLRDTTCYYEWGQGEAPQTQDAGVRPTQVTTILETGMASVKKYTYDSFSYAIHSAHCNITTAATTYTASRGNIVEEDDYDWAASGTLGTLLRKTTHSYLNTTASNASAYVAANIVDKISSTSVYNGAGTLMAQTNYTYDDYSSADGSGLASTSGAPAHDYSAHSISDTLRGELTQANRWLNSGSGTWLTTAYSYNDLGEIVAERDPLNHVTVWSYTDEWQSTTSCQPTSNSYAYPTSMTVAYGTPIAETTQATYFPCTGLTASVKGPNDIAQGRNGTVWTYDSVGRKLSVALPDGGSQATTYSDYNASTNPVASTATTVTAISATPALNLTSMVERDGIGRPRKTTSYTNSTKKIYSRVVFDAMHRTSQQWNPSYCDPDTASSCTADAGTFGSTVTQYDALDRPVLVIPPDGTAGANHVATTYSGNSTTATDQAGAARTITNDALGRSFQVTEGSEGYLTLYIYDALSNLICVEQHGGASGTGCSSAPSSDASSLWRVRRFSYDSLSRLLTTKNPETGQTPITYAYDADSNVISKTNTRGITITYSPSASPLDALNRVTEITYSDGTPTVSYSYDSGANGIGHRTGMVDGSGSSSWTFDPMGRTLQQQTTIGSPGITKTLGTLYNLDGSARQITYPSGDVVTITPGDHGLPASVTDSAHTYASGVSYGASGMLTSATYGQTGTFGGIVQSNSYNSRMQPSVLSATASGNTLLNLMYDFGLGTNDNGNVYHVWNEKVTSHARDQAFSYDDLNRIQTAQNGSWGISVNLDAWGNVVGTSGISGTSLVNTMPLPSDLAANVSNQPTSSLVSYVFTGGNLTSDGTHSYQYDAEDRLKAVDSATYTYNGDGARVAKSSGTLYWGGLAESDSAGNITSEFIFLNGKRLARRDAATGNVYYFLSDMLGSSSVVTDAAGNIQNESDFYPYGGESTITNNLAGQKYKFTGKERDAESGLDDFGARYYNSTMGRFMTPDWSAKAEPVPYAKLANPQSLNLYAYVGNNPASMTDPNGHLRVGTGREIKDGTGYLQPPADEDSLISSTGEEEDIEESAGSVVATEDEQSQSASSSQQPVVSAQQQNQTQTVTVIVTSDTVAGKEFGSHAAIWLDNGPDGAALYDPGGSYHQDTRGTGGVLTQEDDHASLQDYIKYQESSGSKVSTVNIKISAKDEATIYQHASDNGERRGLHCAADVSRAVSGVGPFKNVKEVFLPGTLLKEARSIAASQ